MAIKRRETEEVKKFDVAILEQQATEFANIKDDEQIKESLFNLYASYKETYPDNAPLADKEINLIIKNAYAHSSYFGYLIGDVLLHLEKQIDKGKSSYSSVNDYLKKNKTQIGCHERTAYNYLYIRKAFKFETYLLLGYTNAVNCLKIEDENQREEFIKLIKKNPELSTYESAEKIQEIIGEQKQVVNRRKQKEIDKIKKTNIYNLVSKGNTISFTFNSEDEREFAQVFFDRIEIQLKKYIMKESGTN